MDDTLTPERYERLCEIVERAESLQSTERDAFLETACDGDPILLRKSREMLSHRAKLVTGFLKGTGPVSLKSAAAVKDDDPLIGQQIGHYRIDFRIDSGGMGTVYRAERVSDYRETVAIKVIRAGMHSADFIQRFRTERQVLAGLRHPNVATLLDGGTLTDGRPYLVMEFIEGEAITQFCDRHKLTIDQRLHLVKLAAAGVQHAHQRAVLHRDLKPGNIMVTPKGAVKLVDFGIAKLIRPEAFGQQPFQTQANDRALTPQYASPEQMRDQAPLTASDVYSLSVVLYELLVGSLPYDLAGLTWSQMEKIVCEVEPPKPSAAIGGTRSSSQTNATEKDAKLLMVSESRRMTPRELRRKLRGDLDNIVLKALRKEPDRRYATAEQLIADLERYRKGLPVIAQKDSRLYRTKKFVYRNRFAVVAATLMLLSLVAGLIGTGIGLGRAMRAETKAMRRFDEIRSLATVSVFDIHDRIAELPGSTPVRDFVVNIGIEYLDNLARETGDEHPDLLHELATAYIRAGDAAGNPWQSSLGNHTRALDAYRKANQLAERLVDRNPENATYFHTWLAAQVAIVDLFGVTQPIEEAYRQQLVLTNAARKKSAEYEDEAMWQQCYLHCLLRLAMYEDWRGKTQETLRLGDETVTVAKRNLRKWPEDPESHRGLYRALIGASLYSGEIGKSAAALQHINEAIAVMEELRGRGVTTRADLFVRASMEVQLGDLQRRASRSEIAEKAFRTAAEVYGQLASQDPRDLRAQSGLADVEGKLALALLINKRNDEAVKLAQQARNRLQPYLSEGHGPILVTAMTNSCRLGDCYAALSKPVEAETAYREGVEFADRLRAKDGQNIQYIRSWLEVRRDLADFYLDQKKFQLGLSTLLPTEKLLESLQQEHSDHAWYLRERDQTYGMFAELFGHLNRWSDGISSAEKALAAAKTFAERDHENYTRRSAVARNLNRLARLFFAKAGDSKIDQEKDLASAAQYCKAQAILWDELFNEQIIPEEQIELARTLQTECANLLLKVTSKPARN